MAETRFRAWLFNHPDMGFADGFAGLSFAAHGGINMIDGDASIRQAICLLLSTMPGERVMRPTYGCLIHTLVFAPNDETTAGLAMHYVQTALAQWEPRIDDIKIDVQRDEDEPGTLFILLNYRVKATQHVNTLSFRLDLLGDQP